MRLLAILLGCVMVVSACVARDSGDNEESDDDSGTSSTVAVITDTIPITILIPRATDRWELDEFEASGAKDRVTSDLIDLGVVTIVPARTAEHSGLIVELRVSESVPSGSWTSSVVTYDDDSAGLSVTASVVGSVPSCSELTLTGIDVRGKPGCALDRDVAVSLVIWEERGFIFSAESATLGSAEMIEWLAIWELIP